MYLPQEKQEMGIPWWPSGWESVLLLQGAWVQSLVGELGSCKPRSQKKGRRRRTPGGLGFICWDQVSTLITILTSQVHYLTGTMASALGNLSM